jgi:hypothetical protein
MAAAAGKLGARYCLAPSHPPRFAPAMRLQLLQLSTTCCLLVGCSGPWSSVLGLLARLNTLNTAVCGSTVHERVYTCVPVQWHVPHLDGCPVPGAVLMGRQFERALQYSRMRLQTSSTVTVVQSRPTTAAAGQPAGDAAAAESTGEAAAPSSTEAQQPAASSEAAAGEAGAAAAAPPAPPEMVRVVQTVYTDVTARVTWIAPSPEDGTCFRACIAGPGSGKVGWVGGAQGEEGAVRRAETEQDI